jgi:hypothetical protein
MKNKISKNYLKKLKLNSQFTNFNTNTLIINNLFDYKTYLNLSFKNFDNQEINNIISKNFDFEEKLLTKKKKFSLNTTKLKKKNYKSLYYKKNEFISFFNTNNDKKISNYELNQIITIEDADETTRIKQHNFPIKIIKGTLNKHNLYTLKKNNILEKNILFSYKISNKNLAAKASQPEQF